MEIDQFFDNIGEDCGELDIKINKSVSISNLKFLNYNSYQKVCVSQYVLVLNGNNHCLTCYYEVVSRLDLSIDGQHFSQHFTGSVNELAQICLVCSICNLNLYQFHLVEFCMLCNHCTQ